MQTTKNQKKKDAQSIPVATRVTKPMHQAMISLLSVDAHINIADYLRDLIRRDLEDKGIVFEPIEKEPWALASSPFPSGTSYRVKTYCGSLASKWNIQHPPSKA